jgi:CubicO group peptidase (beta-lactamase class C family)
MPEIDQQEITARVGEILNRWPAAGLAAGVVRNGSLQFFRGHGVADIASNAPVSKDTIFRGDAIARAGAHRPRHARQ